MNIVLIGYRCSGKTAVGGVLARELDMEFLDTDLLIEAEAGRSIDKIISEEGWAHFRDAEKGVIEEVSVSDNQVIAPGGGAVMDGNNVRNLKRNGFIVWLRGDAEVLKARMERDPRSAVTRPSLTGTDPLEEIHQVLDIRTPLYEQAGNIMVDTGPLSIEEVAERIIKALPKT